MNVSMNNTSGGGSPIISTLGTDPDLGELVDMFVDEMPDRIANLLGRLEGSDWAELQRAAHQLKGAAGSYGFGPLTPQAAKLEDAIRGSRPEEEIRQATLELVDMCRRAQSR